MRLKTLRLYLPHKTFTGMRKIFFFTALFLLVASVHLSAQITPADTSVPEALRVFEKAEVEASVNLQDWRRHLEKQLISYLQDAAVRGMKPGTYTVNVRFLVEKDGRMSNVKALNDPGYGLAIGAVRTVRTGPRWTAGEVNGQKVRSYHTQPITFQIQEK